MKIFYIPIEPYETRYTADWIEQFETEFKNNNIEFETILGDQTTTKLKPGTVLDGCGTNIYKFSQLQKLLKKINNGEVKDNDAILFADMWFPGLESLFYVKNVENLNFKIFGILHAGTWDHYDFTYRTGMECWARPIEESWIQNVDKVFVATEFHKDLITYEIMNCEQQIEVTGIPFYGKKLSEKYKADKEDIIVFPHRVVPEKNPQLFERLSLIPELSKFKFIKTLDVCKNRDEYFKLLAKAKYMISFADQETFGYSTVESMALGCKVIVPDHLSYQETVPEEDRYNINDNWVEQVKNKILDYEDNYKVPDYSQYLEKWEYAIKSMITNIKRRCE